MPITRELYEHWMIVGDATVSTPAPGQPVASLVRYTPPKFLACVAKSRASLSSTQAGKRPTTAELQRKCEQTYVGIQARILNFLITGYWLRDEAAEQHVSLSRREVQAKFDEEKRSNYPTAASLRRFQEASRQTTADLMFAVETELLSARLLDRFGKTAGRHASGEAAVNAFNESVARKWTPRTLCQPTYVVKDCRQYKGGGDQSTR